MARGDSGRIVLEINPSRKDELYSALTKDGLTLKDWFLKQANQYLQDRLQVPLVRTSIVAEKSGVYGAKSVQRKKKPGSRARGK